MQNNRLRTKSVQDIAARAARVWKMSKFSLHPGRNKLFRNLGIARDAAIPEKSYKVAEAWGFPLWEEIRVRIASSIKETIKDDS